MNPAETVTAFIRAIERKDLDAALALVTSDVEYDNVPMSKVHGPDAIRTTLGPFLAGASAIEWIVHRQTATGDVVMNERTDRFHMAKGWIEIAVVGVWELRGGKIALWRDYFDLASFTKQLQG